MKFLLLGFIIYAPGTILYYITRRELGKQLFTPGRVDIVRRSRSSDALSASTASPPATSPSRPMHGSPSWQAQKTSQFGVHSEVGQLRKVMVCAPGLRPYAPDAVQLRSAAVRRCAVGG